MKKFLLTTTALTMGAGTAVADVTLSGFAEMGLAGGSDSSTRFHTDIDVTFGMSGTTDGGLTFGADIDLDEAVNHSAQTTVDARSLAARTMVNAESLNAMTTLNLTMLNAITLVDTTGLGADSVVTSTLDADTRLLGLNSLRGDSTIPEEAIRATTTLNLAALMASTEIDGSNFNIVGTGEPFGLQTVINNTNYRLFVDDTTPARVDYVTKLPDAWEPEDYFGGRENPGAGATDGDAARARDRLLAYYSTRFRFGRPTFGFTSANAGSNYFTDPADRENSAVPSSVNEVMVDRLPLTTANYNLRPGGYVKWVDGQPVIVNVTGNTTLTVQEMDGKVVFLHEGTLLYNRDLSNLAVAEAVQPLNTNDDYAFYNGNLVYNNEGPVRARATYGSIGNDLGFLSTEPEPEPNTPTLLPGDRFLKIVQGDTLGQGTETPTPISGFAIKVDDDYRANGTITSMTAVDGMDNQIARTDIRGRGEDGQVNFTTSIVGTDGVEAQTDIRGGVDVQTDITGGATATTTIGGQDGVTATTTIGGKDGVTATTVIDGRDLVTAVTMLMDNATDNDDAHGGVTIYMKGPFGNVTLGDTDGAFDWAMTETGVIGGALRDDHTSHPGYNGNSGLDGGHDGQILRYDYTFGGLGVAASLELADSGTGVKTPNDGSTIIGVGGKYSMDMGAGSLGVGVGYQNGTAVYNSSIGMEESRNIVGISADASMESGIQAIANWSRRQSDITRTITHVGIGLGYSTGPATIGVNWGRESADSSSISAETGYGLSGVYELGGGAELQLGISSGSNVANREKSTWSLGLAFSF